MKRTQKSQKRTKFLFILIILTAILSITATYAWFSTQRDVEIVGMRLNVEVAESMQISLDGKTWTQSINIADMRQFYGSYTKNGTEGFAIYQANPITADDGNSNYVPTELLPVSSAGTVTSGKLDLVTGSIKTDATGTTKLESITSCSETDLDTVTTSIADRQSKTGAGNKVHPYLVFDMYLRNVSAAEEGTIDKLKLNTGSHVWINTATTDDTQQEGAGVAGTGLEYSARVGFIVYNNTVSITATDTASQTVAEQVRAIGADGNETAVIWEPNDKDHTDYVVTNNGRSISATSQAVTTYAVSKGTTEVADINSTSTEGTGLAEPQTMKPAYSLATGTTEAAYFKDVSGNDKGLKPNTMSRVRVYVWLEGQDPDCVDMASTGDKLNVTIRLDRDANSKGTNSYASN